MTAFSYTMAIGLNPPPFILYDHFLQRETTGSAAEMSTDARRMAWHKEQPGGQKMTKSTSKSTSLGI